MKNTKSHTIGFTLAIAMAMLWAGSVAAQTDSPGKQLVYAFTDACNTRNYDRLKGLVQRDFHRHCQATPAVTVSSLDEFIEFLGADANTFPDAMVRMDQLVEEGDRVAFWGKFTGTQKAPMGPIPASNKKVELDVSGVFRLQNGKIAELWITWDNMAVFTQLELKAPKEETPEKKRIE